MAIKHTLSMTSAGTVLALCAYGVSLFVLAVICAGAGDGTYIPFRVFSSPMALVSFKASLFGCPLLWAGAGILIVFISNSIARTSFWVLMIGHYTGILVIAAQTAPREWSRFYEAAGNWGPGVFVLTAFGLYAVGQGLIWRAYRKRVASSR